MIWLSSFCSLCWVTCGRAGVGSGIWTGCWSVLLKENKTYEILANKCQWEGNLCLFCLCIYSNAGEVWVSLFCHLPQPSPWALSSVARTAWPWLVLSPCCSSCSPCRQTDFSSCTQLPWKPSADKRDPEERFGQSHSVQRLLSKCSRQP